MPKIEKRPRPGNSKGPHGTWKETQDTLKKLKPMSDESFFLPFEGRQINSVRTNVYIIAHRIRIRILTRTETDPIKGKGIRVWRLNDWED